MATSGNAPIDVQAGAFVERIEAIFTVTPLERRVALYLLLLRDILALVPPRYDVADALMQVQESLHAHNIEG